MRFLADHNVSGKVIDAFKNLGFLISPARRFSLESSTDEEIVRFANERGLTLLTLDKNFSVSEGEPYYQDILNGAGAIVFAYSPRKFSRIIQQFHNFRNFISQTPDNCEFRGKIMEVTTSEIRVFRSDNSSDTYCLP